MATAQKILHEIVSRIDPTTKKGQKINENSVALTVTGATNASPIVITTSVPHNQRTGDEVNIQGVGGNTAANNTTANPRWVITYVTPTTFSLEGSAGNGAYTSGGKVVPALVGAVDGDKFSRDRHLIIYNDARLALFRAMKDVWDSDKVAEAISRAVVESQIEFTRVSNRDEFTLPAGYLRFDTLVGFSTTSKRIEEIVLLPQSYRPEIFSGLGEFTQNNDIRFVFEVGGKLIHYGMFCGEQLVTGTVEVQAGLLENIIGTGTLFLSELAKGSVVTITGTERTIDTISSNLTATVTVPFSSAKGPGSPMTVKNYKLTYIGITPFTLADILGGTVTETINDDYHSRLTALAVEIARGIGGADLSTLAKSLIQEG